MGVSFYKADTLQKYLLENTTLDKTVILTEKKVMIFFQFLNENIIRYSLEA